MRSRPNQAAGWDRCTRVAQSWVELFGDKDPIFPLNPQRWFSVKRNQAGLNANDIKWALRVGRIKLNHEIPIMQFDTSQCVFILELHNLTLPPPLFYWIKKKMKSFYWATDCRQNDSAHNGLCAQLPSFVGNFAYGRQLLASHHLLLARPFPNKVPPTEEGQNKEQWPLTLSIMES